MSRRPRDIGTSGRWLVGSRSLCDNCALRLRWRLTEAKQLADLCGLDLEQLRKAVAE